MVCVKKENLSCKSIIFSTEFFFYTCHMISQFFMKRLCKRVAHEDANANFLFQFLKYKICVRCILK
jgi:hypothetical protein